MNKNENFIHVNHTILQINNCPKEKKPQNLFIMSLRFDFVRMKGLEPPRREAPDPKSGAAANYATSAILLIKGTINLLVFK
jgi:hypothetical protein